jgi:hypothetical protein
MDETTRLGTIWSETLMDILCVAVRQQKENETRSVLKEMRAKRYRKDQIRKYAVKNLEPSEVAFLERALKSLSGS